MVLSENQLLRLYQVFDFEEHEEIVSSELVKGQLSINYIDNIDGIIGCYKPHISKSQLRFILKGIPLKRQ